MSAPVSMRKFICVFGSRMDKRVYFMAGSDDGAMVIFSCALSSHNLSSFLAAVC